MADTDIRRGSKKSILDAKLQQLADVPDWAKSPTKPTYTPAEVGALALTAMAADSDKLDGVHLADIRLGQNILHNWDFRNPVNQRGVATGLVSGYSYTFDRWLMSPNAWITVGSTVNLPIYNGTPKYIDQRIERDLRGRTYTLSVDLEGVGIKYGVINYPANGAETPAEDNGLRLSLLRIGEWDTVRIVNLNPGVEYQIKRVKLELGTVSTLHLDPPMDWAAELAKCQRFYEQIGSGLYFLAYAPGYVVVSSMFKAEKRITSPTISLLTTGLTLTNALSNFPASPSTVVTFDATKSGIRQLVIGGFSGLTAGSIYYSSTVGDYIAVSADL